jgi:hypothetical protein
VCAIHTLRLSTVLRTPRIIKANKKGRFPERRQAVAAEGRSFVGKNHLDLALDYYLSAAAKLFTPLNANQSEGTEERTQRLSSVL